MRAPITLKRTITEAILKELKGINHPYSEMDMDSVMFKWWMTGRQSGMRLTEHGSTAFKLAQIEYYDFVTENKGQSWNNYLLEINNKIKFPYYMGTYTIEKKKKSYIRLYDSKIAMMIGLYGSFREYLDSVKK